MIDQRRDKSRGLVPVGVYKKNDKLSPPGIVPSSRAARVCQVEPETGFQEVCRTLSVCYCPPAGQDPSRNQTMPTHISGCLITAKFQSEREREGRISFVGGYGDSSNELMQVELVLGIEITTVLLAKVVSRDT